MRSLLVRQFVAIAALRSLLGALVVMAVVLAAPAMASAATTTFTGSGAWTDGARWDNGVPGAGDDVVIDGTATVTGTTTNGTGAIQIAAGGILSVTTGGKLGSSTDALAITGPSTASVTLGVAQPFASTLTAIDVTGVTMSSTSNTTMPMTASSTLTLDGGATWTYQKIFSNDGSNDTVVVSAGARLERRLTCGALPCTGQVTARLLLDGGTLRINGTTALSLYESTFDQQLDGTVEFVTPGGTLLLERGGRFDVNDLTLSGTGRILAALDSKIEFTGADAGIDLGTSGRIQFGSDALAPGDNPRFAGTGTISGGPDGTSAYGLTLVNADGVNPVLFTGAQVTIAASATVTWASNALLGSGSKLRIAGTAFVPQSWTLGGPGGLDVLSGGTLTAATGASEVSAPTSVASGATVTVPTGSSLSLPALLALDPGTHVLTGGRWNFASGGTVELGEHAGPIEAIDGATLALNGPDGTTGFRGFDGDSALAEDLEVATGGRLTGTGSVASTVELGAGGVLDGTLHIGALVAAGGTIAPGDDGAAAGIGTITVDGNASVAAPVELRARVGSDVSERDRLVVSGALDHEAFALQVDASGNVDPAYAFTYAPVTAASRTGAAAPSVTATPVLTAPKSYVAALDADAIRLAVTETQVPIGPVDSTVDGAHAPGTPSSDNTIEITFAGASDHANGSGLAHYVVLWSQSAVAVPDLNDVSLGVPAGQATTTSSPLADGTWYAFLVAVDDRGNASSATRLGPFPVDATAPAAPAFGAVPVDSTATTATIEFTGEPGAQLRCSLDDVAFATCTSPVVLSGLAVGTHTMRVVAVDAAGNQSAVATTSWKVDAPATTPPTDGNPPGGTTPPNDSTPPKNTDPQNPTPPGGTSTPPVKPALKSIVLSGKAPKFATLAKPGTIKVRVPVTEANLKVTVHLQVNKAQAKVLGLKLPRGKQSLVIGTGTATSKSAGSVVVTVKLSTAAKAAFKNLAASAKPSSASTTLVVTLARGTLTSTVRKPLAFKR